VDETTDDKPTVVEVTTDAATCSSSNAKVVEADANGIHNPKIKTDLASVDCQ
jgi:hypothetical protein